MSAVAPLVSEREFAEQVRHLARLFGWRRYHTLRSKGSTAGWPDEVLVRPPRLIAAELKADVGRVSEAQRGWLDALAACNVETYLWRPRDLEAIAELLRARERPDPCDAVGAWEVAGDG